MSSVATAISAWNGRSHYFNGPPLKVRAWDSIRQLKFSPHDGNRAASRSKKSTWNSTALY